MSMLSAELSKNPNFARMQRTETIRRRSTIPKYSPNAEDHSRSQAIPILTIRRPATGLAGRRRFAGLGALILLLVTVRIPGLSSKAVRRVNPLSFIYNSFSPLSNLFEIL